MVRWADKRQSDVEERSLSVRISLTDIGGLNILFVADVICVGVF
jgi:hypothetical protein